MRIRLECITDVNNGITTTFSPRYAGIPRAPRYARGIFWSISAAPMPFKASAIPLAVKKRRRGRPFTFKRASE